MLYLLESLNKYKIGFTKDFETLKLRMSSYKTHNPNFTLLGVRDGSKEDEKYYHRLLNCQPESEWTKIESSSFINNIKNEFILEAYIASLFKGKIEEYNGNINEIYSFIRLNILDNVITNETIIEIVLTDYNIFIVNKYKTYKVNNLSDINVKTFYCDYDKNGEKYSGFILNDIIFYDYQQRGSFYNQFGSYVTKENNCILTKIFSELKEFTFETEPENEIEEE